MLDHSTQIRGYGLDLVVALDRCCLWLILLPKFSDGSRPFSSWDIEIALYGATEMSTAFRIGTMWVCPVIRPNAKRVWSVSMSIRDDSDHRKYLPVRKRGEIMKVIQVNGNDKIAVSFFADCLADQLFHCHPKPSGRSRKKDGWSHGSVHLTYTLHKYSNRLDGLNGLKRVRFLH